MNFVDEVLRVLPFGLCLSCNAEDVTPCLDSLDRSIVVSNFFAKLEAGLVTTMPELFQSCIQRQQVATCRTTHRELLVSRLDLEQAFRARKRGRAMGESGLPGELFALALAQMASMCSVLCSKPYLCAGTISIKRLAALHF